MAKPGSQLDKVGILWLGSAAYGNAEPPRVGGGSPRLMVMNISIISCGHYARWRDMLVKRFGWLPLLRTRGVYYVMTDISKFEFVNDVAFARHLVESLAECGRRLRTLS